MNGDDKLLVRIIEVSHPDLPLVIAPSIGNVNNLKIKTILEKYKSPLHFMFGCFMGKKLVGIIGIELISREIIIKHISVLKDYRDKGIGRVLIHHIINYFPFDVIHAETDDEAVGFYRKLGFCCNPIISRWGVRYNCIMNSSINNK